MPKRIQRKNKRTRKTTQGKTQAKNEKTTLDNAANLNQLLEEEVSREKKQLLAVAASRH